MANMMTRLYSNLKGCDFTNDPAKVSLNRSPNCINMYKDYENTEGNCIQTRPGLTPMFETNARKYLVVSKKNYVCRVNGIFVFKKGNQKQILFHINDSLYASDYPLQDYYFENKLSENMNDEKSSFVVFDNKLYINDGKNYLVYDGEKLKNVSEDAFIPTTTISRKPIGGGVLYQDVNVLTSRRRNSFCADGESTEYHLDTKLLDDEPLKVYINDIEIDSTEYSINKINGIVTFNTPPEAPLTEGQDNVIIEFAKWGTDYKERIANCKRSIAFDNRIFFTGNLQYSNAIFHCELNNPAYVSDLAYYQDGTSDSVIKDFTVGNNLLWVFKESSQQNDTIFYHTPTIDAEAGKIYPSKQGNISTGCVSRCVNFNDDIVFLSSLGLEGITGNIDSEQLINHRSTLIDGRFINENNYSDAVIVEWKGYLLILVNGSIYLADSRQVFQGEKGGYEYEWYYWIFSDNFKDNFGSPCMIQSDDGELLIGTSKGFIYKLDRSSQIDEEEIHVNDLNVERSNIYSCWQTPYDIFGDTNNLKTTNKRGGVAKIKTIPNGKIKVSVQTNRKPEKFIKEYSANGFDFNDIDFNNFAFTLKDMSYIVYKIKMKKFIDLTLKFYSEDRPFGLYDATIEVFQGSYIKRT